MGDAQHQVGSAEALMIKRREIEEEKNPDIPYVDSTVLKDGPRAFKSASHLVIVDRHTREIHHHVVKIETLTKRVGSWVVNDKHTVTLDDEHEDQIGRLLTFLNGVKGLPDVGREYAVVPISGTRLNRDAFVEMLNSLSKSDVANVIADVLTRIRGDTEVLRDIVQHVSQNPSGSKEAAAALNIARYSAALDQLAQLIESSAREPEFQALLSENPWMFGSEYSELLDRRRWTRDEQQDFMLRRTADGCLEMIEIKTPLNGASLFLDDRSHSTHYPRQDLAIVLGQVTHYLEELDANQYSILAKDKESVSKIRAKIIIGRDGDERQLEALRRFNGHLHRIEILTFDQLLRIARQVVHYLEQLIAPPQ